jgi:hypothetical protein
LQVENKNLIKKQIMKKETIYLGISFLSLVLAGFCSASMWFTADNKELIAFIIGFSLWCMIGTLSMSSYLYYKTK